jgi:hypothetical protein
MTLIKGAVLGGLAMLVWSAISWMAPPFHGSTLQKFTNEDALLQGVAAGAPRGGMYLLPSTAEKMAQGPGVLAASRVGPMGSMGLYMLRGLLIQMVAAAYGARVAFLAVVGLLIGVAGHLAEWNWWHFSASYVLLEMADLVISWTLAGLVIAKVAK